MTLAVALLVVFARLVALIVCVPNACGGLYNPELEMVPTVLLPLATPSTLQRTDLLVVLVTVAVNCCVWVKVSPAVLGRTVTETCAAALEHRLLEHTLLEHRLLEHTLNVKRVRSRILFIGNRTGHTHPIGSRCLTFGWLFMALFVTTPSYSVGLGLRLAK